MTHTHPRPTTAPTTTHAATEASPPEGTRTVRWPPTIACWAAKGGAGTTVVAAALALTRSEQNPLGAVLVDLAGDIPAALGLTEIQPPDATGLVGVTGWQSCGDPSMDQLLQYTIEVTPRLTLLPRGSGQLDPDLAGNLGAALTHSPRPVVVDCGTRPTGTAAVVADQSPVSVLVTRPCFLALRHARSVPRAPTGVVVVREPGRVLGSSDVTEVVAAPILAEIPYDAGIARAVDAGLLPGGRLPRPLHTAAVTILRNISLPPAPTGNERT